MGNVVWGWGTQDAHFCKGYQAVPSRPSGKFVGGKQSKFWGNEESNCVVKRIVGSMQQRKKVEHLS
jgi:hypothetical protein